MEPFDKNFIQVQGARVSFHCRWLERALNLAKGSLAIGKWPLGRELVAAKDACFGPRKGRVKRTNLNGNSFHKQLLFNISVRGVELPCHAPRRNCLFVEMTGATVRFIVDETLKDVAEIGAASLPLPVQDGESPLQDESSEGSAPRAPQGPEEGLVPVKEEKEDLEEEEEEEEGGPGDVREAIDSALAQIKSLAPGEIGATWHGSRSQICVTLNKRKKSFLAPSFKRSCQRGDARTPLATAVDRATEWLEDRSPEPAPLGQVPLAAHSAGDSDAPPQEPTES